MDTYYQLNTFKMIFKFMDYNFDNQIVKKIKSMFNFMSIFHCSMERFLQRSNNYMTQRDSFLLWSIHFLYVSTTSNFFTHFFSIFIPTNKSWYYWLWVMYVLSELSVSFQKHICIYVYIIFQIQIYTVFKIEKHETS